MTETSQKTIDLIVNADDYGYFPCVSRGIVDAVRQGIVTATGILANSQDLASQIEWLRSCSDVDVGVHLTLTSRRPLTEEMAEKLSGWKGCFPGVFPITGLVLSGKLDIATIRSEWRRQIETCLSRGLELTFLNSHEHVHMLPVLFRLTLALAQEYGIPFVRVTMAEWEGAFGLSTTVRNALIDAMYRIDRRRVDPMLPRCLGLGKSGKLDLDHLGRIFSKLRPGSAYELMCHPGHFDSKEISDPALLAYHAWDQEYALLGSPELKSLYRKYGIRPIRYRDLIRKTGCRPSPFDDSP